MNDRSVGSNLNLLFVGHAIALALGILGLVGVSGGIWSLVNLASLVVVMVALDRLKFSHPGYGKAFRYEMILIVFALISGALLVVIVLLPLLAWLLWPVSVLVMIGSNILNYLVIHFTSLSTADMVRDAGDLNTASLGDTVDKIYLICTAVSVICTILGVIPILGSIFNLLGKLTSLASIVGLGLLVYFLYRAKTCLN